MKANKYQAILFDFDGVLADSEPLHYECWREVLKPYGIDLLWSVYSDKCIGVSDRDNGAAAGRGAADCGGKDRSGAAVVRDPRESDLDQRGPGEDIGARSAFH